MTAALLLMDKAARVFAANSTLLLPAQLFEEEGVAPPALFRDVRYAQPDELCRLARVRVEAQVMRGRRLHLQGAGCEL